MKKFLHVAILLVATAQVNAQIIIQSGSVNISAGTKLCLPGNVASNSDITGDGVLKLSGTSLQVLNMNGFAITNLEVASAAPVVLTGNCVVKSTLTFTTGKIRTGDHNFVLGVNAITTGVGANKFIETNGTGVLQKRITAVGAVILPIGYGNSYTPFQYQVTGTPTFTDAYVAVNENNGAHPEKPVRADDFLNAYWTPHFDGISGSYGVAAIATYNAASDVVGTASFLNGVRWDGSDWSLAHSTIDNSAGTVTFTNLASGIDLYAMDKFLLVGAKAFLQGAYDGTTGLMRDLLRGNNGAIANLIPLTDPYRSAPYNFTQVGNPTAETVASSVFNTNAAPENNIVDWVFLELRSAADPSTVIGTRSALIQCDGDIVDVDGVSPVFFKNVDAGNYIIAVRHRNHLGIAADPTGYAQALTIANPTDDNTFDFTTATDAQIFGPATAFGNVAGANVMWAGNANFNTSVKYNGPGNDRDYLLSTVLGGVPTATVTGYSQGDLNMNRSVKYNGPTNDRDYLLSTVLNGVPTASKVQALP